MKKISKVLLLVIVSVAFCFGITGQQVEARDTSILYGDGTITRAEWLHDLTVMFDMTVEKDNMPDDYFSDVTSTHTYYKDIMMAAEFGVIDIEAGQEVKPDEAATREFAAHTLNYCLGYKLEDKTYTYKDTTGIKYPDDTQIAINRGWFLLEAGKFDPEKTITKAEIENMVSDAKTVQDSTQIDENYKNSYEFTSNVIEIPQDVSVYVDKDKNVTIVNCPKKITVGDTFAVYENGVAQVYTAKGITVDGSDTVIVTNDVDIDKVTESVDAQGTEEGDLKQAEAVGDAQITYIEGGTEEQAYENGRAYKSRRRISGNKKISAVKASKKLELGAGKSFTINCTLSNVSVDYKINSGKREAYVKANGTAIITGKGEWDAVAAAGKSGSIELVKIPVAYVGVITVTAEYSMNGEVTLTYTTGFQTGLQYSPQDGFRLTKDFQKKSFTLHSKTKLSAGVTASIGLVKLPVISGKIYAKMGAQTVIESETFDDGKSPKMCTTVSSWLYASAGANASLDFYVTKKSFSKTYDIFNENNSPVRLVYHFEDGRLIYPCSRGLASAKGYFTKWNSRYGSSWGGYGLDENGTPKPVFTYSLDDDGNATITGYTGNVSALVIPDEIDGHKVVALGDNAFKGKKLLEYVEIPNNVVKIGSYVFANTSLTDLKLPEKLTYLGRCVLSGNTGVTEIVIPKTLATVGAEWGNILAGDGPFHESNVQKATLEKGITSIPRNLFHKNTTLTQVTIPDTVTKIEEFAFAECGNLESVSLSDNVNQIGEYAFAKTGIKEISMPDSILEIGDYVFANTKLTELKLPKNLTHLGRCVLSGNTGVTEIVIPKTLITVGAEWGNILAGDGPFHESNVQKATLEKGITSIPRNLFHKNTTLTQVTIPDTVTKIEEFAFAECGNLESVSLSDNVNQIGEYAFAKTGIKEISMPDSILEIGDYVFANTKLTELKLPKNLTHLGRCVLSGNTGVTEIVIPKTLITVGAEWGNILAGDGPFHESNVQKATLEKGITSIPRNLFHKNTTLTQVTIPDTVTKIEEFAFAECGNLESVSLPDNVNQIGEYVFAKTGIKEINIPDTVTIIRDHTFKNCTALKTINWSKSITDIQSYAFENCDALTKLAIPNTVTNIGEGAFYECGGLSDIAVPNSVKSLGSRAFENCDALAKVSISDSVTSMGEKAFYDCNALTDVKLGTGITQIPTSCFEHCDALPSVVLPYRVSKVGDNAFKNCVALTEITIPRATTSISTSAFSYPAKMTVYGISGTYAETFANQQGMKFVNKAVKATNVVLDKTELTLNRGMKYSLTMTVTPATFTDEVSWKSTNVNVAAIAEDGTVTAKEAGQATIKVTVGDVSATCKVNVVQPVTSIYLNKTSLEMTALDTYQLQASVYPSEANNKEVSWESSDEKVATVDENGLVQAKEKGTAVITAKAKDGSEVSRSCKVTVKNTAYVVTDISKLESTHNYENNCSDFWVYTKTGASALNITFNSKTALEEDFDYLYVFDKENKQVGKYTGTQLAGKTITVSGDTVKIQLVSDDAGNAWGFKVDLIAEKVEEECKHTDTTKREVRNAKAATCTLDGYSGDIYCTNCGNLIEAGSVTKAIGHQWDNGVITKAATATQTGIKTYTCTVCKITRTEVIKALGNNTKPIGNSNKPKLKTGEKITDKFTGAVYKVTGKNTVEYVKATSKKASRTIPSTVKLKGIRCQVTSIAPKAFKGDTKIKTVVIPSTVRKIGKEAFAKCKNLKKITIKTTYLSSKKVGANAFKGIHAKATIKVPKKQKKAYQKLLKARGVGKKVTVK
ncbi:leucine-rich repeat protein [Anaerobutyricum hallii]|uniref:leucine-rich repeat protein n=1 Tax=Anaerobutyricum hallii TaxID=39488 RepID=UPI0039A00232